MNSENTDLDSLVNACLDGHASDAQLQTLNHLLRTDRGAVEVYLQLADLHSCLSLKETVWAGGLGKRPAKPVAKQQARRGPSSLHPLQAAAAGLVLGLLSASAVWAYAFPKGKNEAARVIPVLSESFEDAGKLPEPGFPTRPGAWFGDLSQSQLAPAHSSAKEGSHITCLKPTSSQKFSYAFRIFDLSEYQLPDGTGPYSLEVSASFAGAAGEEANRYQIRLAAFREEPAAIKPLWNGGTLFDYLLKHVARTVTAPVGVPGWQTLRESIEIPSGTRSIVVSLAAGMANESSPKTLHYLDDVQVRLIPTRPRD